MPPEVRTLPGTSAETHPQRGEVTIRAIQKHIIPHFPSDATISVLDIGLGFHHGGIYCIYEPYRIAGYLQSVGRTYTFSAADIDPAPLNDFRTRRHLFLNYSTRENNVNHDWLHEAAQQGWLHYLHDTNQERRIIHEHTEGLIFDEWCHDLEHMLLARGFQIASIPTLLREQLDADTVDIVQSHIANLVPNQFRHYPFDCISVQWVMAYLPKEVQQHSLHALSALLSPKGILVINDNSMLFPYMHGLFKRKYFGWLNPEDLSTYNLTIRGIETDSHDNREYTLGVQDCLYTRKVS